MTKIMSLYVMVQLVAKDPKVHSNHDQIAFKVSSSFVIKSHNLVKMTKMIMTLYVVSKVKNWLLKTQKSNCLHY